MYRTENWTDHISNRYKRLTQKVADDHGEELSRLVMGVIFHALAEVALKRVTPAASHVHIDRTFGFNIGLVPGNPYHDAKKAADAIAMPLLRSLDTYAGSPAKHGAAWAEQQFQNFEQGFDAWINRNWK